MKTHGFRQMIDALDRLEAEIIEAALEGADAAAAHAQDVMRATTAYNNQTWATRTSTTAYVAGPGRSPSLARAVAQVDARNPGHSEVSTIALPDDVIAVIMTVPTDYVIDLETRRGGRNAFIKPTLHAEGPRMFDMIVAAIRRRL